jgi:hypothetical protein
MSLSAININNKTIQAFATAAALDNDAEGRLVGPKVAAFSKVNQIDISFEVFPLTSTLPHDLVLQRAIADARNQACRRCRQH